MLLNETQLYSSCLASENNFKYRFFFIHFRIFCLILHKQLVCCIFLKNSYFLHARDIHRIFYILCTPYCLYYIDKWNHPLYLKSLTSGTSILGLFDYGDNHTHLSGSLSQDPIQFHKPILQWIFLQRQFDKILLLQSRTQKICYKTNSNWNRTIV